MQKFFLFTLAFMFCAVGVSMVQADEVRRDGNTVTPFEGPEHNRGEVIRGADGEGNARDGADVFNVDPGAEGTTVIENDTTTAVVSQNDEHSNASVTVTVNNDTVTSETNEPEEEDQEEAEDGSDGADGETEGSEEETDNDGRRAERNGRTGR